MAALALGAAESPPRRDGRLLESGNETALPKAPHGVSMNDNQISLHLIDWLVIVLYFVAIIGIGIFLNIYFW